MKKVLVLSILVVLILSGFILTDTVFADKGGKSDPPAGQDKVLICHKPGTPAQMDKWVPKPALDGHLGHGDHEGSCEPLPEPTPTEVPPTEEPTEPPSPTPTQPTPTQEPPTPAPPTEEPEVVVETVEVEEVEEIEKECECCCVFNVHVEAVIIPTKFH